MAGSDGGRAFLPRRTSRRTFQLHATARDYVQQGMQAFRQGNVSESIRLFDAAEQAEPRYDPYLWQRGLSYYYANRFDLASAQFRRDVRVNPLDVEEIVWDTASRLRAMKDNNSIVLPLPDSLSLPPNQTDRRPIMGVVDRLFRGQATEQELRLVPQRTQSAADEFYALFYLGLFSETALRDATKAENYLKQAVHTPYATTGAGRGDYMTDVARVSGPCKRRGRML